MRCCFWRSAISFWHEKKTNPCSNIQKNPSPLTPVRITHMAEIFSHIITDRAILSVAPAAPRNFKLMERTSSSLTVTWDAPLRSSSKIKAYRIVLWKGFWKEMAQPRGIEIRPTSSAKEYTIEDLEPNTQYNLEVIVFESWRQNHEAISDLSQNFSQL